MKKITLLLGVMGVFALVSCESEDTCHCEISKKIYDENGDVRELDYQGSVDGNCENIEDKDTVEFYYQNISCD